MIVLASRSPAPRLVDESHVRVVVLSLLLVVIGLSIDQHAGDASQIRSDVSVDRLKRAAYTDVFLQELYGSQLPAAFRSEIAREHQRLLMEAIRTEGTEAYVALNELMLVDGAIIGSSGGVAAPLAAFDFDVNAYTRARIAENADLLDVDARSAEATAGGAEQEATELRLVAVVVAAALALSTVDRLLGQAIRSRIAVGSWLVLVGAGLFVVLR